MRTIQDMVQQEILCCMSSIVNTLSQGYGASMGLGRPARELENLAEQAFELAAPIADYEEAAIQAGWRIEKDDNGHNIFITRAEPDVGLIADADPDETDCGDGWSNLCSEQGIEPYDRDVYEHWAVTDWFADKLIEAGEKVDKDFGALCIWARTTTGQAIHADGVIKRIYAETHKAAR